MNISKPERRFVTPFRDQWNANSFRCNRPDQWLPDETAWASITETGGHRSPTRRRSQGSTEGAVRLLRYRWLSFSTLTFIDSVIRVHHFRQLYPSAQLFPSHWARHSVFPVHAKTGSSVPTLTCHRHASLEAGRMELETDYVCVCWSQCHEFRPDGGKFEDRLRRVKRTTDTMLFHTMPARHLPPPPPSASPPYPPPPPPPPPAALPAIIQPFWLLKLLV